MINLYNMDCMDAMKDIPDGTYDLAIVDPPYGLKEAGVQSGGKCKNRRFNRSEVFKWDIKPSKEYFTELMRVSKNQIIWGANYFDLPPSRCIICWDKCQYWSNFSQWEMAWTSFNKPASLYKFDNKTGNKIHPTQKPVALYQWLLDNYAKPGDKILDTHLGSGSIAIACHNSGYDLDAYELDFEYFHAAKNRLWAHQRQLQMF